MVHSAPSFNCSGGNCGLSKIVLFEKNVNEKKIRVSQAWHEGFIRCCICIYPYFISVAKQHENPLIILNIWQFWPFYDPHIVMLLSNLYKIPLFAVLLWVMLTACPTLTVIHVMHLNQNTLWTPFQWRVGRFCISLSTQHSLFGGVVGMPKWEETLEYGKDTSKTYSSLLAWKQLEVIKLKLQKLIVGKDKK